MGRRKAVALFCVALIAVFLLLTVATNAAERKWVISVSGGALPIISGQAGGGGGSDVGSFDYNDAFDVGYGFYGAIGYNFGPVFSAGVGGGYQTWQGSSTKGLEFDDLNVIPVYGFGKINLYRLFSDVESPWAFDLWGALGAAYRESVDVNSEQFWDSNWVFFGSVGPAAEYDFGNGFDLGLNVDFQYVGAPDSKQGDLSDGDGFWSSNIRLTLGYSW